MPPPPGCPVTVPAWRNLPCGLCTPAPVVRSPYSHLFPSQLSRRAPTTAHPQGPAKPAQAPLCPHSPPSPFLLTLRLPQGASSVPPTHQEPSCLGPLHRLESSLPRCLLLSFEPLLKHLVCSKPWIQSCPFLKPYLQHKAHPPHTPNRSSMRAGLGIWSVLLPSEPRTESFTWREGTGVCHQSWAAARSVGFCPELSGPNWCSGLCLTLNSLSPFPKKLHSIIRGHLIDHAPPYPSTLPKCDAAG